LRRDGHGLTSRVAAVATGVSVSRKDDQATVTDDGWVA
jgi:hypothetical protein